MTTPETWGKNSCRTEQGNKIINNNKMKLKGNKQQPKQQNTEEIHNHKMISINYNWKVQVSSGDVRHRYKLFDTFHQCENEKNLWRL